MEEQLPIFFLVFQCYKWDWNVHLALTIKEYSQYTTTKLASFNCTTTLQWYSVGYKRILC